MVSIEISVNLEIFKNIAMPSLIEVTCCNGEENLTMTTPMTISMDNRQVHPRFLKGSQFYSKINMKLTGQKYTCTINNNLFY